MNTLGSLIYEASQVAVLQSAQVGDTVGMFQPCVEPNISDHIIAGLSSLAVFSSITFLGGKLLIPFDIAGPSDEAERRKHIASTFREANRRRRIYLGTGALALVPSAMLYMDIISNC